MVVGVCHLDIFLPNEHSLKSKRKVLKSLIGRVRGKFNVSIAEVSGNDLWQRAHIGICLVGNDRRFINAALDKVVDFVEGTNLVEVIGIEREYLSFNYHEG